MAQPVPLDNLLTRLINDSHDVSLLWQLGVLAVCALLAWGVVRLIKPYLNRPESRWSAGRVGICRVGFPLLMLLGVLLGREIAGYLAGQHAFAESGDSLAAGAGGGAGVVHALRYLSEPRESIKALELTIVWLIWGAFALHITGLLPRIAAAMEAVSFQSGSQHVTILTLFQAALVVVLTIVAALTLSRVVERRIMGITQMNLSLRMALSKAARTVFLVLGVLVALPAVGIDLTVLSVFGGALGVGIGFGLQKVASNYMSGFIILLDRSVRIGDLITVDNKYGEVSQINTRYTLLKALDGTESIIPNEMLIAQTVVNHSLSKPNVRVALPIQVSYDTDLEQAQALMLEAARSQSRVILDEADNLPKVLLKEFADNGVLLELAVWIRDAGAGQNNLRSDINWEIWRRFKLAGIEIPFPQRVVHLASSASLPANNP